jgi:hypothetical protein
MIRDAEELARRARLRRIERLVAHAADEMRHAARLALIAEYPELAQSLDAVALQGEDLEAWTAVRRRLEPMRASA